MLTTKPFMCTATVTFTIKIPTKINASDRDAAEHAAGRLVERMNLRVVALDENHPAISPAPRGTGEGPYVFPDVGAYQITVKPIEGQEG